eukprot:29977-Pelagococcus_subviridis.AAC.9
MQLHAHDWRKHYFRRRHIAARGERATRRRRRPTDGRAPRPRLDAPRIASSAPRRIAAMVLYDMFIAVKSTVPRSQMADVLRKMGHRVLDAGGVITDITSFGTQTLAYQIRKQGQGHLEVRVVGSLGASNRRVARSRVVSARASRPNRIERPQPDVRGRRSTRPSHRALTLLLRESPRARLAGELHADVVQREAGGDRRHHVRPEDGRAHPSLSSEEGEQRAAAAELERVQGSGFAEPDELAGDGRGGRRVSRIGIKESDARVRAIARRCAAARSSSRLRPSSPPNRVVAPTRLDSTRRLRGRPPDRACE